MKKYSFIIITILSVSLLYYTAVFSQVNKKKDTIKTTTKVVKELALKTVFDTVQTDSLKPVIKPKTEPFKQKVHASYYADKFHGRKTASGKVFDMHKLTAAHKKLPFGTKLKVTNVSNGKSVIVEVNDRGPYVKGRELDLSKKAFSMIANTNRGFIIVDIEILK
jgi:rare lipoprotein A